MKIEVPNDEVTVGAGFKIVLDDRGSALVAIKVEFWQGDTKKKDVFHSKTMEGPKTFKIDLAPGIYDVFCTIAATRHKKGLGIVYNSFVTLEGGDDWFRTGRHEVPKSKQSDVDSEMLLLTIT
jgi:hypothetical protein